jgi:hypothetical protein
VYSTLEDVGNAMNLAMTNFSTTHEVNTILYNDQNVTTPMNTFIARDTLTLTERIRLDLQCDKDRAMHGLLGVSFGQDP